VTGEPHEGGGFLDWLRLTRAAHQTDADVDVPCGDCVACCTSSYFIHVRPDDEATLRRVPAELLVPAPGAPKGHVVMGYDESGKCPMLEGGRCSIYQDRPLTCRTYDCRVFAAAGIDADRPAITARARTWVFDEPTDDDRRAHAAVRAAARFLREHPECFEGGARPDNPAHVALLAVKAYEVFLGREEGTKAGGPASDGVGLADAVTDAARRFKAARSRTGGPHP
jgi:uncharacterized protein